MAEAYAFSKGVMRKKGGLNPVLTGGERPCEDRYIVANDKSSEGTDLLSKAQLPVISRLPIVVERSISDCSERAK